MHPERNGHIPTPEDQLDAWLDAFVAGSSTPATSASDLPGAPSDPALVRATSAARQLHDLATAANAQSRAVTTTNASFIRPTTPSWEDLVMTSIPAPAPIPIASAPHERPRTNRRTTMDAINRVVSIAAVLAILIAGAGTAWLNRDRLGLGDDRPLLQLAASPTTTVTCTTRTLSQEDVDRIAADYREPTLADYTITDRPVPEADALGAIATYRAHYSCPFGDPADDSMRWFRSTETEGSLAVRTLAQSPAWSADRLTAYKSILEPLSRMLVPPPASTYIVDSEDPSILPYLIVAPGSSTKALLPSQFVQFADGRIGAPLVRAVPGGGSQDKDLSRLTVEFIVFKQVDGRWLIDDALDWLCAEDCSAAQGQLDEQIANYRRLATTDGSPVASPEASPKP